MSRHDMWLAVTVLCGNTHNKNGVRKVNMGGYNTCEWLFLVHC